ncbi:hypothetical protein EJB05_16836 [Eragrostis curvula]|uniref:Replication factor A C-terminal domain-containing protein n=1 Tax=Eragrostis curvula TaxID=38414 RepID=A0A5J9VHL6_9POAL|nr:hypothetical protein EJB05_16836 [Eragrostis curvula]
MEGVTELGLSRGWVAAILDEGDAEGEGELPRRSDQPVLQVASLESVRPKSLELQCLLKLSDGLHCVEGSLFSELNHLVSDGVLRAGAVLRVLEYICTNRQDRRFIIVRKVEVIKIQCGLIGSPQLRDKFESKSEQSARTATSADPPLCESYSGGLCITSPYINVEDPNILELHGTCDGFHSPEKGVAGSSAATVAESVVLKSVAQIKDRNLGCSDNQNLIPCIALGKVEGANSLVRNGTVSTVGSLIASKTEPVILKTVAQIKDENLGFSVKQGLITVKAILTYISTDNFCYAVCPLVVNGRECNSRLVGNVDGTWHCDICKHSFTSKSCDYKFVLVIQISDATGKTWAFAFQDVAEEIFGRTAKELYLMKCEEQNSAEFDDIIGSVRFHQYLFQLKVETGAFDGKQVMKCTVVKAEKVDPPTESSEFGCSNAANVGFSILKAPSRCPRKKGALSRARASHTERTISPGDAMHWFSADQLDQLQGNTYGVMPAAVLAMPNLQACSTCGFALFWAQGTTAPQVWTEQQPAAEGFIYGSSVLGTGLKTVEASGMSGSSKS